MRWIVYSITIAMMLHERHGEWEHQPHRVFFSAAFPGKQHTKFTVITSVTGEFPSQRASNAGLFFVLV